MTRGFALAVGLAAVGCLHPFIPGALSSQWSEEWNGRIDRAATRFEHPCATRPFIAWADDFLAVCVPWAEEGTEQCSFRRRWVRARSDQCQVWTRYLLRNHNRHERDDTTAEPSMKVN